MSETNPSIPNPAEKDNTFYNVMPEVTSAGKIQPLRKAPPKPTSVNGAGVAAVVGGPSATNITMTKRNLGWRGFFTRKAVFIPLLIIILGIAGTVTWLLTNKKAAPAPVATTNTNSEPADPEVTTPAEWLNRYFGSDTCVDKTTCGDKSDPDRDGLSNREEYDIGTDPNLPDSDNDGVADGDEKNIFGTDPLIARTYRDGQYTDADFVKGGYSIKTNAPYTPEELADIKAKVHDKGLHQPTLTTIGPAAMDLYAYTDPNATALSNLNIDTSPQAKLDRDTQRQTTIKKVGGALLKYLKDKKSYPATSDFNEMTDAIKKYITVATNYSDPINKDQYVYGYSVVNKNLDFTLSYFSETQNQLIKYTSKDAQADAAKEASATNNQQRQTDLENIKSALLVYSAANVDSNSNQVYVFPTLQQYPSVLIPKYLKTVPIDPKGSNYQYTVNSTFDSFTLKAQYENPPKGVTGYECTEEGCQDY